MGGNPAGAAGGGAVVGGAGGRGGRAGLLQRREPGPTYAVLCRDLLSAAEVARYLSTQNPQLDIFRAAFLGDQARVAEALAADPSLLQAEDPMDPTYFMPLLAFPVAGGQATMLAWLLERGAPVAPYSAGLLCRAAVASRMDLLELLIAYGADVRAMDCTVFAATSDLGILTFLLDRGISATRTRQNGFPPLVYVARGDKGEHADKVELLLSMGPRSMRGVPVAERRCITRRRGAIPR